MPAPHQPQEQPQPSVHLMGTQSPQSHTLYGEREGREGERERGGEGRGRERGERERERGGERERERGEGRERERGEGRGRERPYAFKVLTRGRGVKEKVITFAYVGLLV